MKQDNSARQGAIQEWSENPCGTVTLPEQSTEASYFKRVEIERYKQQHWMHNFFRYETFTDKKVLEVGIGHGTDLMQFSDAGAHCFGIDITPRHIQLTRQNFIHRNRKVNLSFQDASQIAFKDHSFDAVYSFGVLHHIPEIENCIQEIHRTLKPGGTFMIALYYKWSAFHIILKILYEGILRGKLFKLGYKRLLATIDTVDYGKEGPVPYVKTYDQKEMAQLLKSFSKVNISVRQLEAEHFEPILMARIIPNRLIKWLDSRLGWYVIGVAQK
ncbi:class I SAM-dependent methyltransferase [Magnetococcales bacterium HHB-1]